MIDIEAYIESGILESYVMGAASEAETRELLFYKERYPELQNALYQLETDLERMAEQMAIVPPSGTWQKIEDRINEITTQPESEPLRIKYGGQPGNNRDKDAYIEVEGKNSHIRIHKNWKWVFAAVFVLGKIFLGFAIYFYLENRQAQQQIQELKTELRQLPTR